MTPETLMIAVMNEPNEHNSIVTAVQILRRALDRCAERVAKERAEWHDDPEADDYEEHHAPAEQQFPRDLRDAAIMDLVRHYLYELRP